MQAPYNPTRDFENKRWSTSDQKVEFRHHSALSLIPAGTTSVLDVGCGEGTFLGMVFETLPRVAVTGVDVSDVGLECTKHKVPSATVVRVDTATTLPFPDNSFDVVTALDVLEHTLEPEAILREMQRVSRRYVIVGVPNFSSFPARLQTLMGRVPENNRPHKGHVYWFNRNTLHELFLNARLTIVDEQGNHQLEKTKVLGRVFKWLQSMFPSLFSLSFVVIASK